MRHLILSVVLALLLIGCDEEQKTTAAAPDIAAGKTLASEQCVGCHGLDGRGTAPGIPNLAAQDDAYLRQSLAAYRDRKRLHAALRDITTQMSDADIANVAGYFANLPPLKEAADATPRTVTSPYEKGKAGAVACAGCHGEDGNTTTPGTPGLAGQQPLYFVAAVRSYLDGRRSLSEMEMLRELDGVDLESLALFYATQAPESRSAPASGDPAAGEPLSARCGGCHGAHGISNDATTPNLAAQDAVYLVRAIKAYRNQSRSHDVMLADNTDEEIANIAAFYAVQEPRAAEFKPITVQELAEKCDLCHGPGVDHPTMAIPKISGQNRHYLVMALRAYRDGKRGSSMMHNMSLPYSEVLIESVATLYSGQTAR